MIPRRDGRPYKVMIGDEGSGAPHFDSLVCAFDWLQAQHAIPLVFFTSAGDAGASYPIYYERDFTEQHGFPFIYRQPETRYVIEDYRFDEIDSQFVYRGKARRTHPSPDGFREVRHYAWYAVCRMNDIPAQNITALRARYGVEA